MQEMRVQSPGWDDPSGGGNGNPFQYSCLENSMDRGAWRAAAHGVSQSQSQTTAEHAGMHRLMEPNQVTAYPQAFHAPRMPGTFLTSPQEQSICTPWSSSHGGTATIPLTPETCSLTSELLACGPHSFSGESESSGVHDKDTES